MPKDTKSLDNNKAPACESRGFVHKKKKACILTHLHQTLKCCFSKEYYIFVLTYALFWHTLQRTFAADSKSKSKELWQRQVFST